MTLAAPSARPSRAVPPLVALVFFIQLLDGTIIATSLPAMAADFGVDPVAMSLGITAYLLALAAVVPAAGWAGERWGARRVLVASIGVFTLASLACALAPTLGSFALARVVQGGAAALMAPVGRLLVLGHAPRSELLRATATITWPALFAPVLGPVLGAAITEAVGWEWNFLLNLPLGLAAVAAFLLLVPDEPGRRAAPFDLAGFSFTSAALLGLLGGLELLVNGSAPALAAAALLAGAVAAGLAVRHLGRAPAPLLDLRVVARRSFRLAAMTAGTAGRVTISATPFLLPLLLQLGFGLSPLGAGRLVLVYFLGNLLAKPLTTPILRAAGFRRVVVANGLLAALFVAAFAAVPPTAPEPALWALLLLAGATRSLQLTAMNTLAFAEVEAAERASAATLAAMMQQGAQLLGVALSVVAIRASQLWRGAAESGLTDLRAAFLAMALPGALGALVFLRLAPGAGAEVTGHEPD